MFLVVTGIGWIALYASMDSEAKWGQGGRKRRFRMDADCRSRAVDETADRAALKGERPVINRPEPSRLGPDELEQDGRFACANPRESQSGQRTGIARASRTQPRRGRGHREVSHRAWSHRRCRSAGAHPERSPHPRHAQGARRFFPVRQHRPRGSGSRAARETGRTKVQLADRMAVD